MTNYKEKVNKMTEEEKTVFNDKKKVAAKAYQERKAIAKEAIKKFLESNPKLPEGVKEAIEYLTGSGARSIRTGVVSELKLLLEAGPLSAIDVFTKFEYGRPTMETKIRNFIKSGEPEDRIWVAFEDGNYLIKGTGENPPKNWTGYIPPVKSETEEL